MSLRPCIALDCLHGRHVRRWSSSSARQSPHSSHAVTTSFRMALCASSGTPELTGSWSATTWYFLSNASRMKTGSRSGTRTISSPFSSAPMIHVALAFPPRHDPLGAAEQAQQAGQVGVVGRRRGRSSPPPPRRGRTSAAGTTRGVDRRDVVDVRLQPELREQRQRHLLDVDQVVDRVLRVGAVGLARSSPPGGSCRCSSRSTAAASPSRTSGSRRCTSPTCR